MSNTDRLCCTVKPIEKCRECGTGICSEHSGAVGRRINDLIWCDDCADIRTDCIDIIDELVEKLDIAKSVYADLENEWDEVMSHTRHCRICRSDGSCDELYTALGGVERSTSKASREFHKL